MFLSRNKLSLFVSAISVFGAAAIVPSMANAQDNAQAGVDVEEVVVTGFRAAIAASLDNKRDAVNSKESIVAEDMGKMVDLNLAEAIQRVPGVAIVREGGEGRQISLRGLGAGFTHVTLNGMEVPASAGGLDSSGGVNRGRGFDFNVFSAELFSRIDVNKSATASIEEGGIAGSVELYSLRPLDNPGFNMAMSGQLGYNDLSEKTDPRLTFIYSDSNDDETFGWMLSAAYTQRTSYQDGFGTVRWDSPWLDGGDTNTARRFAGNNTTLSDEELNQLWFPRLPRQDSFHHDQERLGISGALQFKPTDDLEFGVNYVASRFDATVDAYNSFAQFRRNGQWGWPHNTVESVTVATQGGVDYAVAGTFSGVGLRTESRRQAEKTDFDQLTFDAKWDISDNLVLSGMLGSASSKFNQDYFRANIETLTDNAATPSIANDGGALFTYDFRRNSNVAVITYDIDVTDPDNFYIMDNETIRTNVVDRKNKTGRVDLEWILSDEHQFKFGIISNDRELDSQEYRQNEPVPSDLNAISKLHTFDDTGGFGSDTELQFLVLDFGKAIPAFGSNQELARGAGIQTWDVKEETTGIYAEYNLNTDIAGHGVRVNAGLRNVSSDITATGWATSTLSIQETNSFSNTLPALNLTFDITDDMLARLGVAKTLSRPAMSSLAPIKQYSDVNLTVNGGNSQLEPLLSNDLNLSWEWYFTDEAMVAINYFKKDIDTFISSPETTGPLRAVDVPVIQALYPEQPELVTGGYEWTYRTSSNTEGTDLDGWELAFQQTFSFLPGIWSNFGVMANYSYVDAETVVTRDGVDEKAPLVGMSKNSYNATLFYEVDSWSARISMNSRDDYVTRNIGSNHNYSEATTGPKHVDFSASYNVNENLTLSLEIVNLTDEYERLYTTGPVSTLGSMNLVREYNHTGRQIFFGVRANF